MGLQGLLQGSLAVIIIPQVLKPNWFQIKYYLAGLPNTIGDDIYYDIHN